MVKARFGKDPTEAVSWQATELTDWLVAEFRALADPQKAGPMAAYMKTDMPFYGIQKPQRVGVYRRMKDRFPAGSQEQYEKAVLDLWNLPHREEKYAAIEYARQNRTFVGWSSLPLYERLVREGAWWDFVDDIAINLVGDVLLHHRQPTASILEKWTKDPDMWIRRTTLICHNHHKASTDSEQLFRHCLSLAGDREFFIRKAIGWALREYSYTAPQSVKDFLSANKDKLSSLSFTEASRALNRKKVI